jgi:hypothetical protein
MLPTQISELRRLAGAPLLEATALDRIEKEVHRTIKTGRENLFGFPVDINDKDSTPDYVVMKAVDPEATKALLKKFRSLRFKVSYHKPTDEIIVES